MKVPTEMASTLNIITGYVLYV